MKPSWESLPHFAGFDWDRHNAEKNWLRHRVSREECEQVFANRPLMVAEDAKHSHRERRYSALGRSNAGRLLTVIFTIRDEMVRVISARDMRKKEREV